MNSKSFDNQLEAAAPAERTRTRRRHRPKNRMRTMWNKRKRIAVNAGIVVLVLGAFFVCMYYLGSNYGSAA